MDTDRLADMIDSMQEQQEREPFPMMLNQIQASAAPPPSEMTGGSDGWNTGPKGVLTDYKEAKARAEKKMEKERLETMAHIERHSFKTTTVKDDEEDEDEDERLLRELENDPIFTQYQQRRLEQLGSSAPASKNTGASQGRKFGKVHTLQGISFVDFVDQEHSSTFVIIHIYLNHVRPCVRLREVLPSVAKRFPFVKFGEMISTESPIHFDEAVLPTLIVYMGGEVVESFVRLTDHVGFNFDHDDIVDFLTSRLRIAPETSRDDAEDSD